MHVHSDPGNVDELVRKILDIETLIKRITSLAEGSQVQSMFTLVQAHVHITCTLIGCPVQHSQSNSHLSSVQEAGSGNEEVFWR